MSDLQRFMQEKWDADGATERLYLTHDLNENSIVFDIGGYLGDWSAEIASRYNPNIYIFEPVKEFYESLVERFKGNPKIRVFPFGLASSNHYTKIYKQGAGTSVHVSSPADEVVEFRNIVNEMWPIMQCVHLSDLNIDLVSINIEGGEYDLLKCIIDTHLAYQFRQIMIQFHPLWPSCYDDRNRLRNALSQTHEEVWAYPFIWELWRRR